MRTESTENTFEDFQPEVDALDRFERVIDVQIATLRTIDEKAATVMQLVGVLLGVILTGVTLVWRTVGFDLGTQPVGSLVAFVLGVSLLLLALFVGIGSYLANRYYYGLHRNVHMLLREYRTTSPQYVELIQGSYSIAIDRNKRIVRSNVRRFEWSLSFLLAGIAQFAVSAVLFALALGASGQLLVLLCGLTASVGFAKRVHSEQLYKLDGRTVPA